MNSTDLHALARGGDLAARSAIFYEHMGLLRHVARKYGHLIPRDDAFQEGCLGLLHAIETFDQAEHPDVRFGSYAAYRIRATILRAVGCPTVPPADVESIDPGEGPAAALDHLERSALIRRAFGALSPAQADVISALEGLEGPPESVDHLARRLRCSTKVVLEVRAAGIASLRRALGHDVAP